MKKKKEWKILTFMACLVSAENYKKRKKKKEKENKWKGIVKKNMKKKEKNDERQHTLEWEEKMMFDFGSGQEQK
jgi:hypothetical protein